MLHVDDAHLHAYLDGELETVAPGDVAEVEHHLSECAACRTRLSAAQRLRLQANEILGDSHPAPRAAPDFAALAARSGERTAPPSVRPGEHRRTLHRRAVRLGWAASMLVALCAGWFAREARFRMAEPTSYASREMQAVPSVRVAQPEASPAHGADVAEAPNDPAAGPVLHRSAPGPLLPDQFFALSAVFPERERFHADPEAATEPLRRWAERNPEQAEAYPAMHILQWFRAEVERARSVASGRG
jgi:hypothetical protein